MPNYGQNYYFNVKEKSFNMMTMSLMNCILYLQMVASLSHSWSRGELVLWPLSRILLIPLLIMCAAPRHKPVFRGQ